MKSSISVHRNLVTSAVSRTLSKESKIEKRWLSPNGFSFKIVTPAAVEPLTRVIPGHISKPPYAGIDFRSKVRSLLPEWKEKTPKFASIRTADEVNKVNN